jgi:hypothetical protein
MTSQQHCGRGQSKASFNPSQFTKNLAIQTSFQASKHMKYHVIINGMGGISTANIYFAHFDDNNIRTLTNGIAPSLHKSYNTFSEAFAAFQVYYYPYCTTKQHIDFMNANAPLESSNLNNPCPNFRYLLGNYTPDPTKEVTWTMNPSNPTIAQLCKLSSTCMRQCNNNPSQSYDFLPPEFNRPKIFTLTTSTIVILQNHAITTNPNHRQITLSLASTPATHAHQNLQNTPPHPVNPTTMPNFPHLDNMSTMNISQIQTHNIPNNDEMSQLSHQTEMLTLSQCSGSSPKQPPPTNNGSMTIQDHTTTSQPPAQPSQHDNEMNRPSKNAFLNFTVVCYTTPDGLCNPINQHCQQQSSTDPLKTPYPDGALDRAIHFSVIPGNEHHKQAHIKINNTDASQAIVDFFHNFNHNSNAFPFFTRPPTGIDGQSVDNRPPTNNSFPTNC